MLRELLSLSLFLAPHISPATNIITAFNTSPATNQTQIIEQVDSKNCAVFLIDMQRTYRPEMDRQELNSEVRNQKEILRFAINNNIPIYNFKMAFHQSNDFLKPKMKISPLLFRFGFLLNTNNHVVTLAKKHTSAFRIDDLDRKLKMQGIDQLIVMGFSGSVCVKETLTDALNLGYTVLTSPDLILDFYGSQCYIESYQQMGSETNNLLFFQNHREIINHMRNKRKD